MSPSAFEGTVTLVWPKPRSGLLSSGLLSILAGDKPVTTVTDVTVHVSLDDLVWADLTMWVDTDGHPLYGGGDGEPLIGDGGVVTSTFPFLVAEMRVAEQKENDHG